MIQVLIALTAVLLALGAVEYFFHVRCRKAIGLRIHVNGTRGKSSVSRLIGAGLRGAGRRAVVKTTGSAARIIFEDGSEHPVVRPGPPRIIEQLRMFRIAATRRADAMVLECMALQPYLQYLSEKQIVRAHIAVITNVRPDHLDVMGPHVEDVALALGGVAPRQGVLVVRQSQFDALFEKVCRETGSRLVRVTDADVTGVSEDQLARFSYVEHAENVAIALAVCEAAGVPRRKALQGMFDVRPDPGALRICRGTSTGGPWVFADAFSANDPESNLMLWNMLRDRLGDVQTRVLVVNCRPDRLDRSRQLGRMMARDVAADLYVLAGRDTLVARRAAEAAGLARDRMTVMENAASDAVFDRLLEAVRGKTLIVGMGNIKGLGEQLAMRFRRESRQNG